MKNVLERPAVYVDQRTREINWVNIKKDTKKSVFKATAEYHPTHIIGSCSVCRTVGTLEFPAGFSYNIGDKVMDRKKVVAFCLTCRKKTEFVPLIIDGIKTDAGRAYLKKLEEKTQSELMATSRRNKGIR